jgi:hypothetical protein
VCKINSKNNVKNKETERQRDKETKIEDLPPGRDKEKKVLRDSGT